MTEAFGRRGGPGDTTELVIFDTEYTTWEGAQERRWMGRNEFKEIIQFGAIKVRWPMGEVLDELSVIVRPKINPVLSEYCMRLTHLSQDMVDTKGISFEEALQMFCGFCDAGVAISYGNDACVIAENIVLNRTDPINFYGRGSPSFINIKYWFMRIEANIGGINSGELWRRFGGIEPKNFTHEHNSISDCYSILQAMVHLRNSKFSLPF